MFACFLIDYGPLESVYFMFPFGTDRPRSLAMQHMLIVLFHSVSLKIATFPCLNLTYLRKLISFIFSSIDMD